MREGGASEEGCGYRKRVGLANEGVASERGWG